MAEETKKTRTRKSAAVKTEEAKEAVQTAEAPAEETDEVALLKAQIAAMKAEMAKQMESFKEAKIGRAHV